MGTAGAGECLHGFEQPPHVLNGWTVHFPCHSLLRSGGLRPGGIRRGQRGWQATTVSGGEVLDTPGQALPQMESVADLDRAGAPSATPCR
ncbi:hypothetical protein GCM10009759_69170 [Kitasatospora saccharophila]|uniref:Methylated-DNA--[protein]-cysteine S-methyltransferase n=1 Tax=Kitasatospora saccharophila TaxID=407973 RepID=A0ABP5JN65_9ACTN